MPVRLSYSSKLSRSSYTSIWCVQRLRVPPDTTHNLFKPYIAADEKAHLGAIASNRGDIQHAIPKLNKGAPARVFTHFLLFSPASEIGDCATQSSKREAVAPLDGHISVGDVTEDVVDEHLDVVLARIRF